jgi:hypothetical protein
MPLSVTLPALALSPVNHQTLPNHVLDALDEEDDHMNWR